MSSGVESVPEPQIKVAVNAAHSRLWCR